MNKLKTLLTWGLLLAATHVMGYTITVDPIQIKAGQSTNLIINLTNTETNLTAYQMKLFLPEGVTVQKKSNGKYAYTANTDRVDPDLFTTTVKDAADGSVLIAVFAPDKDAIAGTSGELIRLPLDVASTVTASLQGSLKNIEFTTVQSQGQKHADVTFDLTLTAKEAQTLSLTALPEMTEGDAAYSLPQQTAQGLTLTWSVADATIASISGNKLTPLKAGTTTVTATQAGNDSYQPFTRDFTLTVNERAVANIVFADANVKSICVANWDTNSDGELSETEAATVTNLGNVFKKQSIVKFDELQYFTGLTSIGYSAFSGCSSLTSVTIPNSVTSIGSSAFSGCSGLTSVTIPNSVTSIGSEAFQYCRSLSSVTIPNSVTSIGESAFSGCRRLSSVTIPNSVTSIGSSAFNECSSLTSVTIPNSVTSIGGSAFWGCSGLTSVTIPNSVTSIGQLVFAYCSVLTSIKVESGNTVYDSRNNCNAIIKTETNELIIGCNNTNIPNSVTSIGEGAFRGCSGLTSITIPNSVMSIGICAFNGCSGLTSVTIPNSVTSIGWGAFMFCDLNSIKVLSGNTVYDSRNNCNAIIMTSTNGLVSGCNNTIIPNGVKSIWLYAFSGCNDLTSVTIPNSVTSIGDHAFYNCSSLTSVISEIEMPFTFGEDDFYNISSNCTLTVPTGTKDAYIAKGWTEEVFMGGIIEKDFQNEQTLDYTLIPEMTEGDAAYSLPQQTTQGLTLTWSVADATIASISGNQLTPLKAGTTTVTATQAGNDSFQPFTRDFTLTVNEKPAVTDPDTDISQMDNVIYINNVEARAGETVTLSIKMKNTFLAEGFGFDLELPDGISVALDEYGDPMAELSTERTNASITNHFDADFKLDGTLNIQAYSTKGRTINGYDGEVARITIKVSEGMTSGKYPVVLKNIAITDENSFTVTVDRVKSTLEVPAYIIGDANNDGNVNVGDLTAISHYILERPDASFLFQAADANQDGNVNVGDLTAVSHLILWGSIVRPDESSSRISKGLDPQ